MPGKVEITTVYVAESIVPLKYDATTGRYTYDGVIKVPICRNVITGSFNYIPCTKIFTENTNIRWPHINEPPFKLMTNKGITVLPIATNNNEYALVAPKDAEPDTAHVVTTNSELNDAFRDIVFEIVDDVTLSESWYDYTMCQSLNELSKRVKNYTVKRYTTKDVPNYFYVPGTNISNNILGWNVCKTVSNASELTLSLSNGDVAQTIFGNVSLTDVTDIALTYDRVSNTFLIRSF